MGWGDIDIHVDINMNIDIHIIINMNNILGVGDHFQVLKVLEGMGYGTAYVLGIYVLGVLD